MLPDERIKPWGTGQAVLAEKKVIHEPFTVTNADDYYDKEAFKNMHDWLILEHDDNAIAMAGFILKSYCLLWRFGVINVPEDVEKKLQNKIVFHKIQYRASSISC